jgi:hypothetical protein
LCPILALIGLMLRDDGSFLNIDYHGEKGLYQADDFTPCIFQIFQLVGLRHILCRDSIITNFKSINFTAVIS